MALMRPNPARVDPRFLLYAYLGPEFQATIRERTVHGSTVERILLTEFPDFPIAVPDLETQRSVAGLLGALDDRIELNRRMNHTLESIARAVFKSWFVDFDPVLKKMEGGEVGLPPDLAALFPSSLDMGSAGIPLGWRRTTLGEVVELHDSRRVPLASRERAARKGCYPYYGAAGPIDCVDDFLFDQVSVLVGEDGSVVTAEGHPVTQYVWGRYWVNNHAHVVTGRDPVSTEHVLLHLQNAEAASLVTGAVQPKLSQTNLRKVPFLLPPPPVCQAFSSVMAPLFAGIRRMKSQSEAATALRDALLPHLLAGAGHGNR
jgi:type I restriction enzyme S subunit